MQLVQHDIQTEDASETEPILSQPSTAERSEESSSSIEITVGEDPIVDIDPSVRDIDEDVALVRADQPQCRICLDTEGEDLIAPCHCKGTQKYVHRSCLDNWRSTKPVFPNVECQTVLGDCTNLGENKFKNPKDPPEDSTIICLLDYMD